GQPLPAGQSGEIRARSEPMPAGYYRDEARSRTAFRDGWFHTADRGRLGADGKLRIEGRLDELINLGGPKLRPGVREEQRWQRPLVREAAAFAVDGADGAPHLAAALALAPGTDPAAVAGHCRELGFTAPDSVLLLESLPRNDLGKVLRAEL